MKNNFPYYTDLAIKTFPLLTGLTFVFGYIGFHTFTAIYNLPVNATDISIIAGIGLLNITYLCILYFVATPKRKPWLTEALLIYGLFDFFLNHPATISGLLILFLILQALRLEKKPSKLKFSQLKIKVFRRSRILLLSEISFCIIGIIISLFFSANFLSLTIAIYAILYMIHKYKRHRQKIDFFKIAIIVLFPIITMNHFINSNKTNILGINSQTAEIVTLSDTLKTEIIFNDEAFLYTFSDSTKIMTAIRKDDAVKIKASVNEEKDQGVVQMILNFF